MGLGRSAKNPDGTGRTEKQMDLALEAFAVAQPIVGQGSSPELSARATRLIRRAKKLAVAREHDKAVKLYLRSLTIMRGVSPVTLESNQHMASILSQLSASLCEIGRMEEALAAGHEALALFSGLAAKGDLESRKLLAANLYRFAIMTAATGEHEESAKAALEAARYIRECVAEGLLNKTLLIPPLNLAANSLQELGRIEEALAVRREEADIQVEGHEK